MAVHGGPKIATSGLVLSLDAANSSKSTLSTVEVLVVAGGGGGGSWHGGGGGGGGLIYSSAVSVTPGSAATVTVGAGGAGGGNTNAGTSPNGGGNGGNSVFSSLTAIGGGGGGSYSNNGSSGGSGGAGTNWSVSATGGSATSGQGFAGGSNNGEINYGGGGGGAGGTAKGLSNNSGGDGLPYNISGIQTYYSGGGGAGTYPGYQNDTSYGYGGLGGGGNGGNGPHGGGTTPGNGSSNTGGGGGGVADLYKIGGAGGSGIVIVRYPGPQKAIGGTVTSSGGYTIHTFTTVGSTTFTPLSTSSGSAISGLTDISNNGNFGTPVNGPTYSSANGGSVVFDGTNDYVTGNISSLTDFTINVWLLRTGTQSSNYPTLIALGTYYPAFYLEWAGNGQVSYIGGQTFFNTTAYIPTNTWKNLCFIRSSSTISAYVNGSFVSSITNAGYSPSSSTYVLNGDIAPPGTPNSTTFWGGNISQVSVYNRAFSAAEVSQNFNAIKSRYYKPGVGLSSDNPATTASEIKSADPYVSNGVYWYRFSDGAIRSLWTDFTTYAPYSFVMVNRIWSGSQNQYLTTEENVTDLGIVPSNSAPSRHSKLSDAYMNEIITPNTIRWAIVGNGSIFYRLDDSPQWYSNHGVSQSCGYDRGFYSGYATPSSSPSWQTSFGVYQACGGAYDVSNAWLPITGIHINDGTYFGGYSGSSSARLTPPSPYSVGGTSNDAWSQNGYVLLSW